MAVPEGGGIGNLPFLLIMIGLTLVAVVVAVFHPIAWTDEEMWLALLAPAALGRARRSSARSRSGRSNTAIVLGPLVGHAALASPSPARARLGRRLRWPSWSAGGSGYGPLAPPPGPDDPARLLEPPARRPRPAGCGPGWRLGLPIVWAAICLLAIPLGVYVVSYMPWALIENHQLVAGLPGRPHRPDAAST